MTSEPPTKPSIESIINQLRRVFGCDIEVTLLGAQNGIHLVRVQRPHHDDLGDYSELATPSILSEQGVAASRGGDYFG